MKLSEETEKMDLKFLFPLPPYWRMEDGGGDGGSIWYSNAKKAKIMVEFVSFIYNSACICFGFGQKIILWSEDLCKKQYNYENVKKLFESLLYHQAQSSK